MRNVVVLCLDTVRKDVFDERATRLSDRVDVQFEEARAASSWSVPSHATVLTGALPHQHGVHTYDRSYRDLSRADTFLGDLPQHEAIGVSANVFAGEQFGFDTPFDRFWTVSNVCTYPQGLDVGAVVSDPDVERPVRAFLAASLRHDHRLASLANGALAFADDVLTGRGRRGLLDDGCKAVLRQSRSSVAQAEEPFVLFCNLMEAHTPLGPTRPFDDDEYDVPDGYTTARHGVWDLMDDTDAYDDYLADWREMYGAAVDYLDRQVVPFVDWLRTHTDRETSVVVTADHGENLGYPCEEGCVRHKSSLSEGLLHVPLAVVNPPDDAPVSSASDTLAVGEHVSHCRLADLLVGLATGEWVDPTGGPIAAEVMGLSAGPEPPSDRTYYDRTLRCGYDGQTKYVWDSLGETRRYSLNPERPCFQRRTATGESPPEWATAPFDADIMTSRREAKATTGSAAVSAETETRLENLGYR